MFVHDKPPDEEWRFLHDIALCVSTHRGTGRPALVWPEMSDTVLRGIAAADHPEEAPPPALRTASEMAQEVARRLGTVLGEPVGAHVWHLAVGYETPETRPGRDMVLLPVRGGCECRGRPVPQQDGGAVFGTPVRLRLRLGEALYLPAHFCYTLAEVHAPCIVIQLVFSGTAL